VLVASDEPASPVHARLGDTVSWQQDSASDGSPVPDLVGHQADPTGEDLPQPQGEDLAQPQSPSEPQPASVGGDPARLVYPPMPEPEPPSRPVLLVAAATLAILVVLGTLLIRNSADDTTPASSASNSVVLAARTSAKITAEISIAPRQVLTASQRVVFASPVTSVTLTMPEQATTVSGGIFNPRIGNLQILTGKADPLNVPTAPKAGKSVAVDLPYATNSVDIVYVAYGAIVKSQPSTAHRAVALATPLSVTSTKDVTSTLHVNGSNVTNIGCSDPNGAAKVCGTKSGNSWTVTLGPDERNWTVIAQLDLSR
jgi:hypothetical protein